VLAVLVTLATVVTSGNLEEFGTVTAKAASQYGYASYTSQIWGDMYYLYVNDTSTDTDTDLAFCGKRGTTLVHDVYRSGTSIPYSGKQLQILKAAWWFFDSKNDGTVSWIGTQDRYVVGRLMTWAVTNGGATTTDGVLTYISNNASTYANNYKTQIQSILTRAFTGEFDSKVTLYYYNTNSSYQQPMIQGKVTESVSVTITLQKTGKHTGSRANLKGAVYSIYTQYNSKTGKISGKVADMPATDKNGKSSQTFTDVLKPNRTYYVKETTAPTGCTVNSTVYTVTPKKDQSVAVNQKNDGKVYDKEKSIQITVTKKDKSSGKKLSGAVYTIYEYSAKQKKYVKASTADISDKKNTITTGSDGTATTGKLYYTADNGGKWKLVETEAPEGYSTDNAEKKFNTTYNEEVHKYTWTVKNKQYTGKIKIVKTSAVQDVDNVDLSATYKVYSDSDCKKLVTTITTNKKGVGKSDSIALNDESQTFYIKEVKAATGTDASTTKATTVTVKDGKTTTFTDKKQTTENPWNVTVNITKVEKNNTTKTLSGAVFTIYEWNGKKYVKSSTITTDKNGKAESPTLYYTTKNKGKWKIKETKAPDGYKLSGWSKEITITSKNTGTVLYYKPENEKNKGKISISKAVQDYTAATATKPTFLETDLYDFSGIQYGVYTLTGTKVDTITLNKSGNGTSKDLDEGTYYIKEVASTVPDTMVSTSLAGINATMQVTVTAGKTTNYTGANTTNGAVDKDGKKIDVDTFLGNNLVLATPLRSGLTEKSKLILHRYAAAMS
jgi:uncharacterized surface anchored protein